MNRIQKMKLAAVVMLGDEFIFLARVFIMQRHHFWCLVVKILLSYQGSDVYKRQTYNDGAAAFTPSYMKDIEDSRYLYQSDAFVWNNRSYGFTLIKDLSQIYASCNRQLTLLFSLCKMCIRDSL